MLNMTVKEASKSKGMIGGAIVVILGLFLALKGEYTLSVAAVGNGLSLMGIRDSKN